MDTSNLKKKPN